MSKWNLEQLLKGMSDKGASDLLLTAGAKPQLRVNGLLEPLGDQVLDPESTQELAYSILSEKQIETLKLRRTLDLSRGFESMSRFRFNIYYQRESVAMAIRLIPFEIPPFEKLGLPEIAKDFASQRLCVVRSRHTCRRCFKNGHGIGLQGI